MTAVDEPRLHVMFGGSAAGSLRQALSKAGRDEQVVHQNDSFSFGPINPADAQARARWVADKFDIDGWDEVSAGFDHFVESSLASGILPVAWFSSHDTQSFTGFLEWLWRLWDAPCEIVDVAQLQLGRPKNRPCFAVSPSLITPDEFIENRLFDSSRPLMGEERAAFRFLWGRLKTENAPLRVIAEKQLVSAPLDYFDPLILSHAETDWRKMARVVGGVLGDWTEEYYQQGDIFLAARIRRLAEAGKLEWRGDLYEMRNCEVKLPAAPKT